MNVWFFGLVAIAVIVVAGVVAGRKKASSSSVPTPAPLQPAPPNVTRVTPVVPPAPPSPPAPHPNATDLLFRPDAETAAILDARVKNAPAAGDGWIPGSVLGDGQNFRANYYQAGVAFEYEIHADGPFEFVWSESAPVEHNGQLVATPPGSASVVVSGPAGTFSGSDSLKLGSVKVLQAKKGEVYKASLVPSLEGPGHAQVNPLKGA